MAYLIGIDEAGYGPNLGPLVIGGTLWEVPGGEWIDLFQVVFPRIATPSTKTAETCLCVGDSKTLYSPQRGLAVLESSVLALLAAADFDANELLPLLTQLDPSHNQDQPLAPWYERLAMPLPQATSASEIRETRRALRDTLTTGQVQLRGVAARILEPRKFNAECLRLGNKASVLTRYSLELVAELVQRCDRGPIFIQCDRHGGRARYAESLRERWTDPFIEICGESAQQSVYRWSLDGIRHEIRFTTKGERFFEVAWASMLAKYVRESAMEAFNAFWQGHCQNLKPTKGYPVDARRFREAILSECQRLEIDESLYWRTR